MPIIFILTKLPPDSCAFESTC